MTLRLWILLMVLAFVWGGSFLFARIAVLEIPPLTLVLIRVLVAALALHVFVRWKAVQFSWSPAIWRDFFIMGLLNNVIPFGLIFYGQQEIGAGLAAIVNAMTPVWTLLFAHVLTTDEKLSSNKILGITLGFSGVAVLIGPQALDGLSASAIAQIAVLGATISYAVASIFGRRFASFNPVITATGQLSASAMLVLPLALMADQPWNLPLPSFEAISSALALAIFCTAFAYLLFFKILAEAGAVNVSLVTLLIPLWAVLFGFAFLGEGLSVTEGLGAGLILLGLVIIDGRVLVRLKQ